MEFKSISIKSFISDLPRVFNENFTKLADFINSKYDSVKNKIKDITDIEITGVLKSNTVITKNIKTNDLSIINNGDIINVKQALNNIDTDTNDIAELKLRISRLEAKVEKLEKAVTL